MKLNEIVNKYIAANKKSTLLIIVSIIISTGLFLVMNIISEDVRNLMIDQAKKEFTLKHAQYYDPTNEDIEFIEKNSSINKVGKSMLLGINDVGNGQTLQILYQDKNAEELNDIYKLKEGKLPSKENEIAVDTWYIKQKNIENPIGKRIKLDYSRTGSDSEILYAGEKEFKITGILSNNPVLKAQGTSIGVISNDCATKNIPIENKYDQIMFTFRKEKDIQKQAEKLIENGNLNKDNLFFNNELLTAISDGTSLKIPYMIVNIVLALATILLIFNIFYILVSSRTKDFGILRAIGFVPSDVSKIMALEVFIYSIISIPIGLILGGLIANFSSQYVIGVIYNIGYVNSIRSQNYLSTYVFSVLLSLGTIIISVSKPLIESAKIEPMTSINRNDKKINIKQNSLINKFMTKIFKDYGNIASKNIQRNRKRTNLAIASMAIVIFLMVTLYTKSTSNFLNDGVLKYWIQGDYLLHDIDTSTIFANNRSYDKQVLESIKSINGVTKVNSYRHKWFNIKIDEKSINKNSDYWKKNKKVIEERSQEEHGIKLYNNSFEFLGIEDMNLMDDVIINGKENIGKLNGKPYIYITKKASDSLNINKGDKINIYFNIIDPKTNAFTETISREFTVGGTVTTLPVTSQVGAEFGGVMSINQFNKFTGVSSYERFDIWASKLADDKYVENELDKIKEKSGKGILIPYKSETAGYEKSENQKTSIMVIVIGVIVILSLFNCCNNIVTNINSRSREFALFRGIGISKNEINKIIKLESFIYVIESFVLAIVPILIVRGIIIKPFENIKLISLNFIGATILIVLILTFIMIVTTSKALKKAHDKDFIQQIKTLQ
nr:FtsX-like permease family protein [Clostridioides sp.]